MTRHIALLTLLLQLLPTLTTGGTAAHKQHVDTGKLQNMNPE
jgi:hypothetical protein